MAKMEDVWDDASEEPLDKDTRVHLSHLFQDGFRTGVALGQEEKVQPGFDTEMRHDCMQDIAKEYKRALASKGEPPVAFPELDNAAELAQSIKPEDAYIGIYHQLAEAKQADLNSSGEVSVLPERIERDKEIHEEMTQLQTMVESWKEKRGSLADRSSIE